MTIDTVLIAGPTASGKSALALELAERLGGAVVNADSMQVYAELRILTARPTPEEEARAPHFLYGHVPVGAGYSAGRYQDDAARALDEIRASGRLPIFVGGTGLYFKALIEGLSPIPPVPAQVRARVRERFSAMGPAVFFESFASRDPETAARLTPNDTQRVLRAADVLEATGRPLKRWQELRGQPVLDVARTARLVIAPPRALLYRRIEDRFRFMVEKGGLEEARALASLDPSLPATRALGVPSLLRHLAGELPLDQAIFDAQRETRRYAKRQLGWLRRFMNDWKWLEEGDLQNIISYMEEKTA